MSHLRDKVLGTIFAAVLLMVPALVGAQEHKTKNDSPSPNRPAASAPAQRGATNNRQPAGMSGQRQGTNNRQPAGMSGQRQGTNNRQPAGMSGQRQGTNTGNRGTPNTTTKHAPYNAGDRSNQPGRGPRTATNAPGRTTGPGAAGANVGRSKKPGPSVGSRPGSAPVAGRPNSARPGYAGRSAGPGDRSNRPALERTTRNVGGHNVGYDRGGRVRTIQTRSGATVYRGTHNNVRVVRELPGGRRVVYAGRNYGLMERNYVRGYRMRTYYDHGRYRAVVYRPYTWYGRPYYVYAPYYYYHPAYYAWAFNPWARPVYYRWGWAGDPWYPYYGYYFAPSPYYLGANLWLTDFILAENLRMAYEAQQNEGAPPVRRMAGNEVQLTPEVKQMIAEEVKQQLDAEKAASARTSTAGSPVTAKDEMPPALDPGITVFVVASNLDVATPDGNECELTPGDVISRIDDTPDSDGKVQVRVTSSKEGDCARGSKPVVAVADLQDMHNRFREQLDAGLKQLAANQGKNGLPAAPDTGTSAAPDVPMPEPDKDVHAQMQGLEKEADEAEQDVKKSSPSGGGN